MKYRWVPLGSRPPHGYRATGNVSRWPDTGKVRAVLYERPARVWPLCAVLPLGLAVAVVLSAFHCFGGAR